MAETRDNKYALSSGREISCDTLTEIAQSIINEYAGLGFENFGAAVETTVISLQRDTWGNIRPALTRNEALEAVGLIRRTARAFTQELKSCYRMLEVKYLDKIGPLLLAVKLGNLLRDNILYRYNSSEYWESSIIDEFAHNNELSEEELDEVMDLIPIVFSEREGGE